MILLAVVAILPLLASADEAKFGYINTYEVMLLMPEVSQIETYMADYNKKNREYLETMQSELQKKAEQLEADKATLSEAILKVRQEEVQNMYDRLQNAYTSFQEDAQKEQQSKLAPVKQKLQDAIDAVAKKQGLTFVFDLSSGAVIYKGEKAVDITAAVKKDLGIL